MKAKQRKQANKRSKGAVTMANAIEGTFTRLVSLFELADMMEGNSKNLSGHAFHAAAEAIGNSIVNSLDGAGLLDDLPDDASEEVEKAAKHAKEADYTITAIQLTLNDLSEGDDGWNGEMEFSVGRMASSMLQRVARDLGHALIALTGKDSIGFTDPDFPVDVTSK